jgi:hypothetical protein
MDSDERKARAKSSFVDLRSYQILIANRASPTVSDETALLISKLSSVHLPTWFSSLRIIPAPAGYIKAAGLNH